MFPSVLSPRLFDDVAHEHVLGTCSTSAWFGDLKDGVHKGDQNDPRVAVIEVVPDSIRYWLSTESALTKAADIAASAITGKTAVPGELRTITKDEVR